MKLAAALLTLLFFFTPALSQTRRAPARSVPRAAATTELGAEPHGQTLPIKRVILYSNGVAYFERRGRVEGDAEINLAFKQSQVDDVLKSMVVLDLGGRVGAVSYNSSAPPSARLAEIPFSIEAGTKSGEQADGGLAGVLKQLQGARVLVSTSRGTATGSILTVEERRAQADANKPPVVSHQLVITSESGEIAAFDLGEVRSVRVLDEGARRDLRQFADATASARRRDAKTIVVSSEGVGPREMLVSYTVAAPIWKTTYRVVLDAQGRPFFQGWAIVDNVGEEDWTQVKLSLVSGTPVSFIQPIQQPLYRYRPVIPIPEDLSLDPQVYEPATGVGMNTGGGDVSSGGGGSGGGGGVGGVSETVTVTSDYNRTVGPATTLSDAITGGESGVEAAAKGSEMGDLFEYSVEQPVTVNRNRSALIPILQTRMEGERVSIYNEAARKDRPMSGLLLKNTSALTLEDGSLTVIEGDAYAGEALLERLKPGEDRFISFALDLATLVNTRSKAGREPVFLVRVVNGVFQAHFYESEHKTYVLTNQTERPRVVYVEHPLREGWRLAPDAAVKPFERTQNTYRFRVELAPRATAELHVPEHRALMDTYALDNLSSKDLSLFVSRNYVDASSRAALERLVSLKAELAAADSRLAEIEREAREIGQDQERLRANIKALNETAEARQLIARYVQKAGEQETRLEQLVAEKRKLQDERARLQAELDSAIRGLALERKL